MASINNYKGPEVTCNPKFNLVEQLMLENYKKVRSQYMDSVENLFLQRLEQLGYTFKSDEERNTFVAQRISRCTYEGEDYVNYFLDYGKPTQILILTSYENRVKKSVTGTDEHGNPTITITIG